MFIGYFKNQQTKLYNRKQNQKDLKKKLNLKEKRKDLDIVIIVAEEVFIQKYL